MERTKYPVALYARVSTADKTQNPETQLIQLREYCQVHGWQVYREYVDQASAQDVAHRTAWRALQDDAARQRFKAVVVFKLDRAFRSVKHMHDTLATWEVVHVDFRSIREGFDTSTALGRLLMNLLASLSEFELEMISERVKAGMSRAAKQGVKLGRPGIATYRYCHRCCSSLPPSHFRETGHKPGETAADMIQSHLSSWEKEEVSVTAIAKGVGLDRRSTRRLLDYVRGGQKGDGILESNL